MEGTPHSAGSFYGVLPSHHIRLNGSIVSKYAMRGRRIVGWPAPTQCAVRAGLCPFQSDRLVDRPPQLDETRAEWRRGSRD